MSTTESELQSVVGRDGVLHFASPWLREDVPLARPSNEAQLSQLLRYAASASKKVLPLGFGSKLGWCAPPEHIDFAISTRSLTGVVAYEPGDGTLTARAGSTLSEIAEVARAGGNHLTPDVSRPSSVTLGGVLAAGQSGLDRLRHGPVRHHVLGMTVVLADGTLARSGGRLVKNVTGFDMHRLYCGSHGTLCVIVEATLRLFPGPEREVSVRARPTTRADALRAARSVSDAGLNAYAVVVENVRSSPGEWNVHALLSGRRESVDSEVDAVQRCLPGASVERDERARIRFAELRDLESPSEGRPSLRIGLLPSGLDRALELLDTTARAAGVRVACSIQPSIATLDVSPAAEDAVDPERWLALSRALREAELDVRLRDAPTAARHTFEQGADLGPGSSWMRRLKHALDPDGVFPSGLIETGS